MKQACLLLISLIFFLQPANALHPAPLKAEAEVPRAPAGQSLLQHRHRAFSLFPFLEKSALRGRGQNPYERHLDTSSGTFSLVCAMLALACIAGVAITSFSLLIV